MKKPEALLLKIFPVLVLIAGIWITSKFNLVEGTTKTQPSSTVSLLPDSTVADQLSMAFERAANKISPSVVPIFAEEERIIRRPFGDPFYDFFGDDFFKRFFELPPARGREYKRRVESLGSGVIVSEEGYILTNNHVIEGASEITVILEDEEKYSAEVIGTDPQSDIAVIKIDADNLPVAQLGDSDNLRVGQWVIAVGNPFRLMHTVTAGIISARGRSNIGLAEYEDFIQTDASINPGNSGGALCDLQGRVVGINTAISSPTGTNVGIGFAIPIKMAKGIMEQLIEYGKVSRGYLGVVVQDINENLADALNLKRYEGVLVGDVEDDGPADKAGLKRGDVIIEFDGKPVTNSTDLRNLVSRTDPGSSVDVVIIRDGKEISREVTLAERPSEPTGSSSAGIPSDRLSEAIGLSVQELTPELAEQLGYQGEEGVVVTSVASGSSADQAGLQRGDLILEVNREAISSIDEFNEALSKVEKGNSVALLIRRGTNTFYVGITIPE